MKRRAQPIGCAARGALFAFGLVFVLMGLPFVWMLFGQPMLELLSTRSWAARTCEVLYVGVQPGDPNRGGSRYRPLVAFAYDVAGREYVGAAFEPSPRDYSSEEDAQAQARALSPGARVACYVDPADPRRAVLLRRFNPALLVGLVPGLFPLVGLLICWAALAVGRGQPKAATVAGWLPAAPGLQARPGQPALSLEDLQGLSRGVRLEPTATPLGAFVGLLFANLVWNGITSVFMFLMWKDSGSGMLKGPGLCFLVFPLVGLLLLVSLPYQFLALFNPRPHVTLGRAALRPGESASLHFELKPMGFRLRRLQILLEGREQVGGGKHKLARHVFYEARLAERRAPEPRSEGELTFALPAGVMHSFKSGTLELAWVLRVVAEVAFFPDVQQEFTLTVLPEGRRR